jgi:outer membrane protein assembly factor BamB
MSTQNRVLLISVVCLGVTAAIIVNSEVPVPNAMALRYLILIASCSWKQFHSLRTSAVEPDREYIWPSGHGRIEHYGSSPYLAPRNLNTSLAWSWHESGLTRYARVPNSVNIDDKKNIYLCALDGIRKFTQNGEMLWNFTLEDPREAGEMPDAASLYKGAVYVTTMKGRVFAISMETGKALWQIQLPSKSCDGNNGWVSVHEGTVITGSDVSDEAPGHVKGRYADQHVTGISAQNGTVLWTFKPVAPVWNFHASFAGDGTFTFQDYEGRAYRNRVRDGTNIWTKGGRIGSWTDGSSVLGPNRVVYTVANQAGMANPGDGPANPGYVTAYRLEDGKRLWEAEVPRAPNNIGAVGRLAGHTGLSYVQPIGQQCHQGYPTDVYALDAESGKVQWIFKGPSQKDSLQAGDRNTFAQMSRSGIGRVRPITLPNPWSAPTIDGDGTVFIGSEEGGFYSLRDSNLDGQVDGAEEVSVLETDACFSGSSSAAIAPGMVVASSIDAMYVFKTQ